MTTTGDQESIERAIARYLATGESEMLPAPRPGERTIDAAIRHDAALRDALIAEVKRRSDGARPPDLPQGLDLVSFTRERVRPMVEGLFRAAERGPVLAILERSVLFLTPESILRVLADMGWPHTAWQLANLYLGSVGREGLHGCRECIVGLSEETTCYVALTYFTEDDRFADFIVHEAAHVFHNWKREYAGSPYTRTREWLLVIWHRKRETFAWTCEGFSRILARCAPPRRAKGMRL